MANVYSPESLGIKPPSGGFQTGGWYSGRQWWNGTLSEPGVEHPQASSATAGQAVSPEVIAQTAPQNVAYIGAERAKAAAKPVTPAASYTPGGTTARTPAVSGVSGAGLGITTPETINLPELYKSLYKDSKISESEAQYSQMEKEYIATKAKINDNPFLSEATRVGRVAKLETLFQERTANIKSEIATKKADIETQLNLQTKQFDINSQAAQQALTQFNTLLSMGALDNASGDDIAAITRTTGISSDMIYSAIQARQIKKVNSQVITSTNDAGVVTATVIDQDTGEIIKQTSLGAIGNVQGTAGGGLSVSQTNALSEYLAQVPSYSSREEALTDLEKYKTSIITKVGQDGYNQILNEVNRIFPQVTQPATQTTQSTGGIFGTIKSFFSNLFGR